MKATIFARLSIGFLIIFLLVILLGLYVHTHLRKLEANIQTITDIDYRLLDYNKKLSDTFLSEVQNEKKYVVSKDQIFYDHFLASADAFSNYLERAELIVEAAPMKRLLEEIKELQQNYIILLHEEFDFLPT